LEFLPSIHTEEKAYSTIYVHHLMLSSTLPLVDNRRIGQHSLVKSLMSGCQSSRQSSQKVLAWIFPGLKVFSSQALYVHVFIRQTSGSLFFVPPPLCPANAVFDFIYVWFPIR
jgi:hypothetical protein